MRIEKKFKEITEKGRSALITYVTAGDPSLDITPDIVFKLEESGADIIELGVPFSDPMADGPTIQLASERALKSGTTLHGVLEAVRKIRLRSEIPILLFGYYNPFYAYGLEQLAEDAREAGVDGILVVDLPPEEAEELKAHTDNEGLDLVFLLAPTSTAERKAQTAAPALLFRAPRCILYPQIKRSGLISYTLAGKHFQIAPRWTLDAEKSSKRFV